MVVHQRVSYLSELGFEVVAAVLRGRVAQARASVSSRPGKSSGRELTEAPRRIGGVVVVERELVGLVEGRAL